MTELSDNFLRTTAKNTLDKICSGQYSDDDLMPLIECLTPEQQTNFYFACSDLESSVINQEISIDMLWEGGDSLLRSEIRNARERLKIRVEAATKLSQFAQGFSDHKIRGSIHYLNKYVKKSEL